ncbi:MAG: 2Fe-2S iron-sulfur cluster binding domain-containing protein [Magnetococcales bacterium]|nr:2Fe-2S iron-sulfur cluster binding domain-containing protein [Magnetococcales bacterium]MBF0156087.1 2Fe-2S iron-sulfur cluster binding domain-containing protein [Magnetococcales bacterium]
MTVEPLVVVGWVLLAVVVFEGAGSAFVSWRRAVAVDRRNRAGLALLEARLAAAAVDCGRQGERRRLAWSGTRRLTVVQVVVENSEVRSYLLGPADGGALPPFLPGEYLTFTLWPEAAGGRPLSRCYSLSGDPGELASYRVTIKRAGPPPGEPAAPPGRASTWFHDRVTVGSILEAKAPSGHFLLPAEPDAPVVLIGAGVGITPFMAMLAARARAGVAREFHLFYGCRDGEAHLWRREMVRLAATDERIRLVVAYSRPRPEDRPGVDYQHGGRIDLALLQRLLPANNFDFYLCGPAAMMTELTAGLLAWGVPAERIHGEAFGPASVPLGVAADGAVAHRVAFLRSGKELAWEPARGTLLALAEAGGVALESGCRVGNCGACKLPVKSGEVRYVASPGRAPDPGNCLACVAIPASDLELDA